MNKSKYSPIYLPTMVLFLSIGVILFICFLFLTGTDLLVDEYLHIIQIKRFSNLNFHLFENITMIPGYHLIIGMIARVLGVNDYNSIRLFTLFFNYLTIPIFYFSCNKSKLKTIQFTFLPIIFPFFFLIYTDIFSLLIILLSFLMIQKGRNLTAGVFFIISLFIRQNNIIWGGFYLLIIYLNENGTNIQFKSIINAIKKSIFFIIGFIIFVIFIIINKGVALGLSQFHPDLSFHTGNIFFSLFLFFIFFLPLNIKNFPKIAALLKKRKIIAPIIFILYIIYIFTFKNSHPWNQFYGNDIKFLRNILLIQFNSNFLLKNLFFIVTLYSVLSITVTNLEKRYYYLLYPFSIIYLLPSWLIEQRYYIIPYTLFIIFREKESSKLEIVTSIYYILLSVVIFFFIQQHKFFL